MCTAIRRHAPRRSDVRATAALSRHAPPPPAAAPQSTDFKRSVRELKNKVYDYSKMEQMVREATCNDARDPNEMLMKEIAKGTFTVDFSAIMAIVWKRIRDKTSEHHPYKCLVVLEFLMREGNVELVQQQINNNLHLIQALTSFRLINEHKVTPRRRRRPRRVSLSHDTPLARS
jgi:hypothetical protein